MSAKIEPILKLVICGITGAGPLQAKNVQAVADGLEYELDLPPEEARRVRTQLAHGTTAAVLNGYPAHLQQADSCTETATGLKFRSRLSR